MERGTLIAGRYELTEPLGRGGMGEVWSGRDRTLHRSVAVKLLHPDDDVRPELVRRFEREAVAAAQMNHPNIVALYDRGTYGHLQFLVMEHVQGTNLAQYLHQHGPLGLDRALEIAQGICAALVAAHEAKVVHYDIKPSNVMLTADGTVKVVDFGIAGFTHTHTFTVAPTASLSPAGTAQYGAPEQFLDERGDERSDLYALGSVLFALLTGEPPFGDGSSLAVIRRKLDEEPRPVTDLRPDVPAPVAQLLADLLRRAPEDRPGTAAAVHRRLAQLRAEVATEAGSPPTDTRPLETERSEPTRPARRWTGNRRVLLVATLATALALTAVGATYYATSDGHHTAAPPQPSHSPSVTAEAKYLRMPDLCGYLQRNDFRGQQELPASELGPGSTANDSRHASCGWGKLKGGSMGFKLTISAWLGSKEGARQEMAKLKPGPSMFNPKSVLSKVDGIGDEAVQSVSEESISETEYKGKFNFTTVWFRKEGLFVTVDYEGFLPLIQTDAKKLVTEGALRNARSLVGFLRDEPENHEKPIWG
ncbi:serine/threonine-protein kinase [Streptomyces sp. NPDC049555]|uniref:serine/threonine protein kinase n=1 Tax=Streptomyces sp. NPDC049555 TaxID=3154930 RepID=UPI003421542B